MVKPRPSIHARVRLLPACSAAGAILILAGCGLRIGGDSTVSAENDRLRAENFDLRTQLNAMELQRQEFRRKVEATAGSPAADVVEATPALAQLLIAPTSHVRPATPTSPTRAVLHLDPRDGRNRPIQITGTVSVVVSRAGAADVAFSLGALALRDAFRGGPFGGGYTVEIPLAGDPAPATAKLTFIEGHGLGAFAAEAELPVLDRPARAANRE